VPKTLALLLIKNRRKVCHKKLKTTLPEICLRRYFVMEEDDISVTIFNKRKE
jgi:hypothetical protein